MEMAWATTLEISVIGRFSCLSEWKIFSVSKREGGDMQHALKWTSCTFTHVGAHTHTHTHFLIIMVRMIAPDLFSSKHSLPLEMAWLTVLKIPTKSCFSYLSEWSFSKDYGRSGAVGRRGGRGGGETYSCNMHWHTGIAFQVYLIFFSLFEIVSAGGNWCNEWIVCTKTCKDILHDVGIQH